MNGFYWIYLIMLGFAVLHELTPRQESRRLLYYGACGFLILIFALQDGTVSVDIAEYMRQWQIIPELSFGEMLTHKFEIGYVLLCWVLERLFGQPRVLLAVLAVGILLPFARSCEKETEDPMVALMAFVALGMYIHAVIFWRQLMAMAILTWSFRFIRERRLLPFLAVVLLAMTFHKISVVFVFLYPIYRLPVNRRLLLGGIAAAVVLSVFSKPIVELGIALFYPRYLEYPRLAEGGQTLLAMLWVVALLSYWLLKERMEEPKIRLPFLMILTAAAIQPVCFAFFWFLRVVLIFRVALVPMTAALYRELFRNPENQAMALLEKRLPRLYQAVLPLYGKKWFAVAGQVALFAVLFVWYVSELDGAVYAMAPVF